MHAMTPAPVPPPPQDELPPLTAALDRRRGAELIASRRVQIMVTADFTDLGLPPVAYDKAVWAARAELQAELGRIFAAATPQALAVQPCIELEATVRVYDPAAEPRYYSVQSCDFDGRDLNPLGADGAPYEQTAPL